MEKSTLNLILAALFFILMAISGVVLTKLGHPLNKPVFALHKIFSLVAIALTVWIVWPVMKHVGLSNNLALFALLTLFFFLVSLVSGALLSFEKTMPAIVTFLHRGSAILVIISGILTGWMLRK